MQYSKYLKQLFCHMLEMREQEGANLKQDLLRRADDIDRMVKEIEMRSPQTVEEYKTTFAGKNERIVCRFGI